MIRPSPDRMLSAWLAGCLALATAGCADRKGAGGTDDRPRAGHTQTVAVGDDSLFRLHARFTGVGSCLSQVIAPGPEPGSERLYASHIYGGVPLDIVAIDPETGKTEVFSSPVPSEGGAWALACGPDGKVYAGTEPGGHVLRLDWKRRALTDLGRPSRTEKYIWQFALGTDKRLYGCTYPQARLVRIDPASGKFEDLGRMDARQLYARSVAADDKGFVYVGIGMEQQHVVAYEIATGRRRDITPTECTGPGRSEVWRGKDGKVYARAGGRHLRLDRWTATIIPAKASQGLAPLRLADGRIVHYANGRVTLRDPKTGKSVSNRVQYKGKPCKIFRIGLAPDGWLYGSTSQPMHFFRADPDSARWERIGQPGTGEFYSFLGYEDVLIGAAYYGLAPIMIYRPGRPYAPKADPAGNPWLVHYDRESRGWRPMAMIAGPLNKVYIGAVSDYGLLGGPLCVLDPKAGQVSQYPHLVKDQSVVALAALPDGMIVGGTTIGGGGGSHPTQTEAKLFLWDPARRRKVFEAVPVPNARTINALAVGRDGLVYGFAGSRMFVFDPGARKVVYTRPHGLPGQVVYNAVGAAPDGRLVGLSYGGAVFTVDTDQRQAKILGKFPGRISAGFAIHGEQVYFCSGPRIVSYLLPR